MPGWTSFVQGLTTVLDSAGTALQRRSTIQFGAGLDATDDGSKTVVTAANTLGYLDTTHSPVALYRGDTGLADQSGNGFDLAVGAGSSGIADISPQQKAIYIPEGARLIAPDDNALRIAGGVTLVWVGLMESEPTTTHAFLSCAGAGSSETSANNVLYSLELLGNDHGRGLRSFWEFGSGSNGEHETPRGVGDMTIGSRGQVLFVAATINGNVSTIYINGERVAGPTADASAPDGGSSARLMLGCSGTDRTSVARHCVHSAAVYDQVLDDDQIKALYNATMGPAFGVIS